MAVAYPVGLPQSPQRNSFKHSQAKNVIRSSVDIGEAKTRRRYTKPIFNETWALQLTKNQVSIFINWFENDIESGVLRFDFLDPITETLQEYRITDMYNMLPYGECGDYMVTFPVERLP